MFEKASKLKLRFKLTNGLASAEDLWDLRLEDLDKLAKSLNKEIKESDEESFISKRTSTNQLLDLRFEIVKHVIAVKLAEKESRALAAEKAQRKAHLEELISKKELSSLESKSIEELKKELESL